MEPVTLAIAAVVLGICLIAGLSVAWWMIKSAVRTAVKMLVLGVALVVMLGAVAAVVGVMVLN